MFGLEKLEKKLVLCIKIKLLQSLKIGSSSRQLEEQKKSLRLR